MRAVRFHEYGGPEVLQVDDEVGDPEAGGHGVVVEVAGAGVNPVDTYFRGEGGYSPFTLPMIPGVDAAGTVVDVGEYADGYEVGDRVIATGLSRDHYGGYAEQVAVPTDRLAHVPEGVDLVEAGAAGVVAVTSWRALVSHAGLEPAETVLIHGGSGGVGHVAVQLAAAVGAHVITTAAPEYHDALSELGANAVFDYGRDDLVDAVREEAGGGVDVILDHRLDDYMQFDADVAAVGCRVVGIGENDPHVEFTNDAAARSADLNVQFMTMFNTPSLAEGLERVAYLMGEGDIDIELAGRYGLEEAAEAQRAVMEDSFLGKLVIEP
jgi:NADPH:quinone reductase-like Zn-dependent oxidoreductase